MLRKVSKSTVDPRIPRGSPGGGGRDKPAKPGSLESKVKRLNPVVLCLLSGVLLALPFNNHKLCLLSWFGFVPLFFAVENKSKIKSFFFAYFAGIIFWLGAIYWLVHVTFAGMFLLVSYLALYFAVFGLIFSTVTRRCPAAGGLLFFPSLWVILEYLRSHFLTGFPWALLGYSQYRNLPVIQIADITGVWGVSFLIILANIVIYSGFRGGEKGRGRKKRYVFIILLVLFVMGYGYCRIYCRKVVAPDSRIKISVIQANIPQEMKWDKRYGNSIIEKYLQLTSKAVEDNPDLIIWPEASLPDILEEVPFFFDKVRSFVKEIKIPLLLGAVTSRNNSYYNSAIFISSSGQKLKQYDKLHLVPFGEYIPLRKTFKFLAEIIPVEDFSPGRKYTVFSELEKRQDGVSVFPASRGLMGFSVLICFEDLFPELARRFISEGSSFLVNITNDAWFKKTAAPYQHLQASVFRAVENRVFLVRAANTGVSGFISPSGKIISLVKDSSGKDTFISGRKTDNIIVSRKKPSFYSRHGDIFILLLLIFSIYDIFRLIRFKKISPVNS